MTSDVHATATGRLRELGQRYTANRRAIVEQLADAGRPLTIPELLGLRDELAQSSAYRNLALLEQAGVVHRIVTGDDHARYELAEALTHHHHHLICSTCGSVEDFTVSASLEQSLTGALRHEAERHGFTTAEHRLDLLGTCARCG